MREAKRTEQYRKEANSGAKRQTRKMRGTRRDE